MRFETRRFKRSRPEPGQHDGDFATVNAAVMDRVYADQMKAIRLLFADVDGTPVTREKVPGPLLS